MSRSLSRGSVLPKYWPPVEHLVRANLPASAKEIVALCLNLIHHFARERRPEDLLSKGKIADQVGQPNHNKYGDQVMI
jgi:hypothetical protein